MRGARPQAHVAPVFPRCPALQDEQTDDDEGDTQEETGGAERSERRRGGSESRATTASALGKRRSEAALGVKSQSSAALSLLATAAANKPAQPSAAAAAQQAVMGDVWGTLNGQPVVASAPDLTRMASDAQMQQLLVRARAGGRRADVAWHAWGGGFASLC